MSFGPEPASRSEPEARAARDLRASPSRIAPTPEDLAIHARTVKRLLRWSLEARKRQRFITAEGLCAITRRAISDALHFGDAP